MSHTKIFSVACAVASLGVSALSAQPCAAQEATTKQESVRFADLDLSTRAGVKALLARLDRAAFRVCVRDDDGLLLGAVAERRRCEEDAMADAVQQARSPAVTQAYQDRRPQAADYRLARQDAQKR